MRDKINYTLVQKTEALTRMKILQKKYGLSQPVIENLEKGIVTYSRWVVMFGWSDTVVSNPAYQALIRRFQHDTGFYVYYACVLNSFENPSGQEVSLLYVSTPERLRWMKERPRGNYVFAYVYQLDKHKGKYEKIQLTSRNGILLKMEVYHSETKEKLEEGE